MKFGEKVRELRQSKEWSQDEFARRLGKSKRTVCGYEAGTSYPRDRAVYTKLAELFNVDVNYLLTEDEEFMTNVGANYGINGQRQAKAILEQASELFAGGELSEEDEMAFVTEIQRLFLDSKKRSKKFSPSKYKK